MKQITLLIVLLSFIHIKGMCQSAIPYLTKDQQYIFVDDELNVLNQTKYSIREIEKQNGFFPVNKDGKSGLVNAKGIEVTGFQYDYIQRPMQKLFILLKNKKYGANAFNGKDSIPFEYDRLNFYATDLLYLKKDNEYQFQYKGKTLSWSQQKYKPYGAKMLSNNQLIFLTQNLYNEYGVLDQNMNLLLDFKFTSIDTYGELILGRTSRYKKSGLLYNNTGKQIVPDTIYEVKYVNPSFIFIKLKREPEAKKTPISPETTEMAIVQAPENDNDLFYWKCIDSAGVENKLIGSFIRYFETSTGIFIEGETSKFLVNQKVTQFPSDLTTISPIDGGNYIVMKNDRYGVADKKFNMVVPAIYQSALDAGKSVILLKSKHTWYVFTDTKNATDSIQTDAHKRGIVGNRYFVFDNSVYDLKTKKNLASLYECEANTGTCFAGSQNGTYGVLDSAGKVLVPFVYTKITYGYREKQLPVVWFYKDSAWQLFDPIKKKLYSTLFKGEPHYKNVDGYFIFKSAEGKEYLVSSTGTAFRED